jgi:hypothetical protein
LTEVEVDFGDLSVLLPKGGMVYYIVKWGAKPVGGTRDAVGATRQHCTYKENISDLAGRALLAR